MPTVYTSKVLVLHDNRANKSLANDQNQNGRKHDDIVLRSNMLENIYIFIIFITNQLKRTRVLRSSAHLDWNYHIGFVWTEIILMNLNRTTQKKVQLKEKNGECMKKK